MAKPPASGCPFAAKEQDAALTAEVNERGVALLLWFLQVYHRYRLFNALYVTTAKTIADASAIKNNRLNRSSGFNATPRKRAFFSILRSATPVAITENPIPAQTAMNSAITAPIPLYFDYRARRTLLTIRVRFRLKQGNVRSRATSIREGQLRREPFPR
jgi:hypothetical protein